MPYTSRLVIEIYESDEKGNPIAQPLPNNTLTDQTVTATQETAEEHHYALKKAYCEGLLNASTEAKVRAAALGK